MEKKTFSKIIIVIEFVVAACVVLLDLFMPTLVILGMIAISLLIRREHIRSLVACRREDEPKVVN